LSFVALPATAAFAHHDARSGFEVVYFESSDSGCRIDGSTAAVEDGQTWIVDYRAMSGQDGCRCRSRVLGHDERLPVRRMSLATGERAEAPATYVRAIDLSVERLDQTYQRADDDGARSCYDYPRAARCVPSRASASRPCTTTRAPSAAKSATIVAPISRELPVTRTTRSCKRFVLRLLKRHAGSGAPLAGRIRR
jgi:hypothetical protein